jgi:hypothetical protein
MKRFEALLKRSRPKTRAEALLQNAGHVAVVVRVTPYKNRKGRTILELVRTTYVIRNGRKTLYGRKAASPKSLLKKAPRPIRPKRT